MDSLIEIFKIDWKIIVAQMINFGIVFFVLYRYAIKPLGKIMDEREHTIKKGLGDAHKNAQKLAETEQAYAEALAQARREASEIVISAKKDAQLEKEHILAEAKQNADEIIRDGKAELLAEKDKVLKDAHKDLGALVLQVTEKVLSESVKGDLGDALVKKSIDTITKSDLL